MKHFQSRICLDALHIVFSFLSIHDLAFGVIGSCKELQSIVMNLKPSHELTDDPEEKIPYSKLENMLQAPIMCLVNCIQFTFTIIPSDLLKKLSHVNPNLRELHCILPKSDPIIQGCFGPNLRILHLKLNGDRYYDLDFKTKYRHWFHVSKVLHSISSTCTQLEVLYVYPTPNVIPPIYILRPLLRLSSTLKDFRFNLWKISRQSVKILCKLPHLIALRLEGDSILWTEEDLNDFLINRTNPLKLQSFDTIWDFGPRHSEWFRLFPELTTFKAVLSSNVVDFTFLQQMTNLQYVWLEFYRWINHDLYDLLIESLSRCTQMKQLRFQSCKLSKEQIVSLLLPLNQLCELELVTCENVVSPYSFSDLSFLSAIPHLATTLKSLLICSPSIIPDELIHVRSLSALEKLRIYCGDSLEESSFHLFDPKNAQMRQQFNPKLRIVDF